MNRRHFGRTLVVALIGLTLVSLPVAGLTAVDDSPPDSSNTAPLTTTATMDDGMEENESDDGMDDDMNDSDGIDDGDGMETTEEMNDGDGMNGSDDMETTEGMNDNNDMDDGNDMDEEESDGGSLDGFGIVAVVLAAVAILGYTRLR